MRLRLLAPFLVLLVAHPARGAVVVVANYTDAAVTFRLAEPGAKAREHKLPSNHVLPVHVAGPADVTFAAKGGETKLRLDMYNAYAFLPDPAEGVRLEGLELPGDPLDRDLRPEPNPGPRDPPTKVPVTVLVDDAEQRNDRVWQAELRKRFDAAAAALEPVAHIKFVLAGFDAWKSDPAAKTAAELLAGFEKAVPVKAGALAVGYTSRKLDPKAEPAFGASRGLAGRHVLVREWNPRNETEREEVLVRYLAEAVGGVGSPDPGSALRAKPGDGYAIRPGAVVRLDPLNALALNLWAEERRREPDVTLATLGVHNRARLTRLYKALLKAAPGDPLALAYLNELDRDVAKNPAAPKAPPPVATGARDALAKAVVAAVRDRAGRNAAAGARAAKGDLLTAEYVREAAEAALRAPGPEMVSAFLVGLGVALDDTAALADDATTWAAVKDLETPAERAARVSALGNPTLGGRRDLCRRFFLGCAVGAVSGDAAEGVAVGRSLFELHAPVGLCVPALAAELAGVTFARTALQDAEVLRDVTKAFTAAEYLPALKGLRDGLSAAKFEELYGDTADPRFVAVLADVRKRLQEMKAYK